MGPITRFYCSNTGAYLTGMDLSTLHLAYKFFDLFGAEITKATRSPC